MVAAGDVLTGNGGAIRLVPDPRRRLPGRGAHVHPVPACLDRAQRRRSFGRALRLTAPVDVEAVRAYLAQREGERG